MTLKGALRKMSKAALQREVLRLHDLLIEVDEVASGGVLRWNEKLTPTARLKIIHKATDHAIQESLNKHGVL